MKVVSSLRDAGLRSETGQRGKALGKQLEDASARGFSWAVIIGKSSGGKSGYVRVATAPQTLLAAPLLIVDSDPKGWLDHTLLDVPVARIRQIDEHPVSGATFTVSRDSPARSKSENASPGDC